MYSLLSGKGLELGPEQLAFLTYVLELESRRIKMFETQEQVKTDVVLEELVIGFFGGLHFTG